jgi:PAS domain S-box-containing protein
MGPAPAAGSLTESEAQLAAIFDHAAVGLSELSLDGRFLRVNDEVCRFLGRTRAALLAATLPDITFPDDLPRCLATVQRAIDTGEPQAIEKRYVCSDGAIVFAKSTLTRLDDADGRPRSLLAVTIDLTHQNRTEQELLARSQQFETLLNKAPLGVYLVDADFRLAQINPMAQPAFEEVNDAIGRDFGEVARALWGQRYADEIVTIFRHTLETGERHYTPEQAELRQGAIAHYEWSADRITLPDGRFGVVCYVRDVSEQVSTRQAIARSEARYHTLFDSIDEGFCLVQVLFDEADRPKDYRFIEINPAFAKQSGLRDALGKTALELVPDIEQRWIDLYGKVALTGESVRFVDHSPAMGRWFDAYAFRVGEPHERTIALLFNDVTRRQETETALAKLVSETERQRRLYDTIISSTPDLVYVFDLDYRFTFVNKALLQMWGRTLEDAIGKTLLEVGYEPWHAQMQEREIDQVVATRQPIRGETPFHHAELGQRTYDYIFVPVLNHAGEVECIVGTTRDITERKRAEDALQQADRRKDEFLATLAHELRNPLAAIRMAVKVLDRARGEPARLDAMASIIERQSAQLVRLIDDLLDVSRITRGMVELRRSDVDVATALEHAVETARQACVDKDLRLTVALPPQPITIQADPVRFAQIIGNLLNNAVKFTDHGGQVQISLAQDGDQAVVAVEDTGVGIRPEDLPRIFEMFVQLGDPHSRAGGGLGIGLALASSLVRLHGGTITARSAGSDQGSVFIVKVPIAASADSPTKALLTDGARLGRPTSPRHILAVDDNSDALRAIAEAMRQRGHQVETASTGQDALDKAAVGRCDVILLDIGMPGMNGYEVAKRIRSEPWGTRPIMIAMTGWGQAKDKQAALEAGFDAHLTKPVDPETIDALLDQHGRSRPLTL